jgi:hypothetical protein
MHNFESTGFEAVGRKIETSLRVKSKVNVVVDNMVFLCV